MLHAGAYIVPSLPFYVVFFRQLTKWNLDGDEFVSVSRPNREMDYGEGNASPVHQRFLAAKTDDEILAWLNETGVLADDLGSISRDQFKRLQHVLGYVMRHGLTAGQGWLEEHWEDPMSRAFDAATDHGKAVLDWEWGTAEPRVVIVVRGSLAAMAVATRVEKLTGARFGLCRFRNCPRNKVFKLESEHKRKYCSLECARADGQRRRRAEAAKPKAMS